MVDVDTIVSHSFLLAETPDAFRKHAENAPGFIKSLIYPNGLSATA
jgi:L-iditol 2-dehydrogenase